MKRTLTQPMYSTTIARDGREVARGRLQPGTILEYPYPGRVPERPNAEVGVTYFRATDLCGVSSLECADAADFAQVWAAAVDPARPDVCADYLTAVASAFARRADLGDKLTIGRDASRVWFRVVRAGNATTKAVTLTELELMAPAVADLAVTDVEGVLAFLAEAAS